MTRMVQCVKIGKELPGMDRPPFPGELGQRIFDQVSKDGWALWRQHQTLLINHYGLNMADPRATQALMSELEEFFFGQNAQVDADFDPDTAFNTQPTKGAPQRK